MTDKNFKVTESLFLQSLALLISFLLLFSACGSENTSAEETLSKDMETKTGHDHGGHDHGGHDHGGHAHHSEEDLIDLSSVANPPNISVVATPDNRGGVNIEIDLENFDLVPLETKGDNQPRKGHLHLEVDGKMMAMFSEKNYYLSDLSNGDHEIVVSLSSIDHRSFSLNGELISDTAMVMITGGKETEIPDSFFEVEVVEGKVKGGLPRFEVSKGDLIEITVYSDQKDEVHLHVYDNMADVGPNYPAVITVEASIPGIFEAELHSAGFRIFELQVS